MPDRTQKIMENNWTTIGQEEKSVCIDAINLSHEEDNTHRYLCITPVQPRIQTKEDIGVMDLNYLLNMKTEKKDWNQS